MSILKDIWFLLHKYMTSHLTTWIESQLYKAFTCVCVSFYMFVQMCFFSSICIFPHATTKKKFSLIWNLQEVRHRKQFILLKISDILFFFCNVLCHFHVVSLYVYVCMYVHFVLKKNILNKTHTQFIDIQKKNTHTHRHNIASI